MGCYSYNVRGSEGFRKNLVTILTTTVLQTITTATSLVDQFLSTVVQVLY
jgi:hypothetical protein